VWVGKVKIEFDLWQLLSKRKSEVKTAKAWRQPSKEITLQILFPNSKLIAESGFIE
jgi:hypothetical protein